MKSLSRRKVDDEVGGTPAKDGPGLQVDGPRAWVWHRGRAWEGAEERGQAGMSAKRSAAPAGGGRGARGVGDLGRKPQVGEDEHPEGKGAGGAAGSAGSTTGISRV